jgi:pilus assembly protein TadC
MEAVEQDLPMLLDLLAALSASGLAFDSALERILSSQDQRRPVTREFRLYQTQVLAGRPKIVALRSLAQRIRVTSLSIFISALVQAQQIGSGVSEVLRRQAEELRARRREQALAKAASLPVKLLFPLGICFLPGVFVVTLGPTFYQFFQMADTIIRSRGLR